MLAVKGREVAIFTCYRVKGERCLASERLGNGPRRDGVSCNASSSVRPFCATKWLSIRKKKVLPNIGCRYRDWQEWKLEFLPHFFSFLHKRQIKVKMATAIASAPVSAPSAQTAQVNGVRKNGKQWHEPRKAFRPTAGQTSYVKRVAKQAQEAEVKKVEGEMKAEKEEERQVSTVLKPSHVW